MKTAVFETTLLPDGHLDCPPEYVHSKDARFQVMVTFDSSDAPASDREIELAAVHDVTEDLLSREELAYYLDLEEP
jgi:hypothetical protein